MIGDLISAGSNLVSGLIGSKDAQRNIKMQKQFAKQGIRWKVEDAKAAGIHPLAALGAQTHSFAPVQTGMPEAAANMGQDLSRAINATRTGPERVDAYTQSLRALQLEGAKLDNDAKKLQLASAAKLVSQPGTPPARQGGGEAIPGQPPLPKYVQVKDHRTGKTHLVANPDTASDFGEMLAPELFPYILPMIDKAKQTVNRAKKQSRYKVRRYKSKSWSDYWLPSIRYER